MSRQKIRIVVQALVLVCISVRLSAQSSTVRQAEKKIAQGNWTAARHRLQKSLNKDSLNPEVEVALSKWFLNSLNPNRHTDSAYNYSLQALAHFRLLSFKQKEKLKRDHVDSASIVSLRTKIDSTAFEEVKRVNSEKSYNEYLNKFQFAAERPVAIELRDEVAFLDALKQNSYQSFENYIKRYPQSHHSAEAKARYQKLLFESLTKDHKLKSYQSFVREFPQSPYRKEAEKNIFEVLTSSGAVTDYIKFIDEYPLSWYANTARNILFHLTREVDEKFPERLLTDSLKKSIELGEHIWIPVYKNEKYGFINSEGAEVLPLQFESIDENYKCGLVAGDILMTSRGLVSRMGKVLSRAKAFTDIGYGFIKVTDSSCLYVMHKSGQLVSKCVEDADVLSGRFLRITKNKLMGLMALNGRTLIPPQFQSIEVVDDLIVLDRQGKKIVVTLAALKVVADNNALQESNVFDEVRALGNNSILVRNGSLEGIVDSNLEQVIPMQIQTLSQTPLGLVQKKNDQFDFRDLTEIKSELWDSYAVHRQWLLLKNSSGKKLFDTFSKKIIEVNPDSLWFESGLAFAKRGDSVRVHVNSLASLLIPADSKMFFVKSPDSVRNFFVQQKNKKTIFNIESGARLFTTDYEKIESLNAEFFVVSKKNKKGLLNKSGKLVLPVEYDVLLLNQNHLSLYKDKKFGMYNLQTHQLIKPAFEKNLLLLDSATLVAFQNGHYGLIDWKGSAITEFEYDEIQSWAHGVVWEKKDFEWTLVDFRQNKKIISHIKNFEVIKNTSSEKVAIVKQDNFFGVLSSLSGAIIAPSFTFLINLGSEEEPIYFTSKEVEEAGIIVVIYYDKQGNLLRKQVYEDAEYARIVCPQD